MPEFNKTTQITGSPEESLSIVQKLVKHIRSKYAPSFLAGISFLESFLPIPLITDPFLVLVVMMDRARVVRLVIITLISSILGGLSAFLVATYFRDWLLRALSPEAVATLNTFVGVDDGTFILTLVGAITPVPYTFVAWAVALSGGNALIFILASFLGRGLRYCIVGWCSYVFGPTALRYARRSILLTSLALIILVALYVWLKL